MLPILSAVVAIHNLLLTAPRPLAGEQSTTVTLDNLELAAADIGTRLIGIDHDAINDYEGGFILL
ncbi:TPA: hypothetical protein JD264_22075 [Serratia fonticola]|nr:hypothetical protein [Serratia fonticola]